VFREGNKSSTSVKIKMIKAIRPITAIADAAVTITANMTWL
jgi:hypothetical protein